MELKLTGLLLFNTMNKPRVCTVLVLPEHLCEAQMAAGLWKRGRDFHASAESAETVNMLNFYRPYKNSNF